MWLARLAPSGSIDSVAVLPFVNANGNPDSEYLSDGLSDTIINSLSQLDGLRVVPQTLVATYKGKPFDVTRVARELNVRAVVTGRLTQRRDLVDVQVELIDVSRVAQLWGDRYSRTLMDVLPLQQEIARVVAEKLRSRLTRDDETQLARQATADREAYQLYLKGQYEYNKRSRSSISLARTYFEQAVARDPSYALAYAGLADTHISDALYFYVAPNEAYPKAIAAAKRSVGLNPQLADPHASLGWTALRYDWNVAESEREFVRALALDPNNAKVHGFYATSALTARGRFDEALAEAARATALDPIAPIYAVARGNILAYMRRYEEGIAVLTRLLQSEPDFGPGHYFLATAYQFAKMGEAAIAESRRSIELDMPMGEYQLAVSLAVAGQRAACETLLRTLVPKSRQSKTGAVSIARAYQILGDKAQALGWLDAGYEQHDQSMPTLNVLPEFDSLRDDPRFQNLVRRVGILAPTP
jgi:TolB-like protein/tetratricopeptide (TPR) repeat protein